MSTSVPEPNISARLASVVVNSLLDFGVREVVLAPGSRSAPLALALAQAEREDKINLHVRVDERGAGFLALGLAKVSSEPVAVITTSGTAVANLMPAVVEAQYAGVPLVVITADRPPRLRNTGSNQTIDQSGFFGRFVSHSVAFEPARTADEAERAKWRKQVAQGVAAARGSGESNLPGPVQLNIGFDVPLLPSGAAGELVSILNPQDQFGSAGGALEQAATGVDRLQPMREPISFALADLGHAQVPAHGVVVIGDEPRLEVQQQAVELAEACGWPVISEPSGGGLAASSFVPSAPLVLGDSAFAESHVPDLVVTVGRVGLSRPVLELLAAADVHVAVDSLGKDRPDPVKSADTLVAGVPYPPSNDPVVEWSGPEIGWLDQWQAAGVEASDRVRSFTAANPASSLAVVDQLLRKIAADDLLFVGASRPVRDVELLLTSNFAGARIVGNRGVSGIDGLVSTAYGAALAHQAAKPESHAFALIGDLATLHDLNGFVTPDSERPPNLTYVVLDNNGGGIFSGLEQGAPEFAQDFERVFGTPQDVDLASAIRALGVNVTETRTPEGLRDQLPQARTSGGVRALVIKTLSREAEQLARIESL